MVSSWLLVVLITLFFLSLVALMAVKDVNSNPLILPAYHLDLTVFDGQCEADVVMKRFIDIIKTKDASRFQSTVGMLGLYFVLF